MAAGNVVVGGIAVMVEKHAHRRAAGRALWRYACLLVMALPVRAEINVGITLSLTGPVAALGIPARNTVALLPARIGGEKINYIVLDDASDAGQAAANARRLTGEMQVDVVIGSSTTPSALAMIDTVAGSETPMLALASSSRLVEPLDARRTWVFKMPQNEARMATAIAAHMRLHGRHRVAFIGFADAYGDSWWSAFVDAAAVHGIEILTRQSFAGTDTSAAVQGARIAMLRPDAVLVAASGTPAVVPHKALRARGYNGPIYQTHGAASADFLRVGGRGVEGTLMAAGPVLVADQLPPGNPLRQAARDYVGRYEGRYGVGSSSPFGAYLWDAGLLLQRAIPEALKRARPGSREFRRALRDALEGVRNLSTPSGVVSMSPTDHGAFDERAQVMVIVDQGRWRLLE